MSKRKSTATAFVKSMQRKNRWDRRRFLSTMAMGGGMLAATRSALGAQITPAELFPGRCEGRGLGHDWARSSQYPV